MTHDREAEGMHGHNGSGATVPRRGRQGLPRLGQDAPVSVSPKTAIYIEIGSKRVFAGALDWPGWSRSGRDEAAAMEALVAYGPRYADAIADVAIPFDPPTEVANVQIAERLKGGSGTDFGAPSVAPAYDSGTMSEDEGAGQAALLQACWATFDRSAGAAVGIPLAKGPRGGGRELDAIVRHVLEAEQAYLAALGGRYGGTVGSTVESVMAGTRAAVLETLMKRIRGQSLPPSRRTSPLWTPRYFVRRSAWHALDHAGEIEDRAGAPRAA